MNEANQFYQRAYLHATERDLTTSVSAGFIAEAFISFGVAGVIGMMFLIGFGLNCLQTLCFRSDSGSYLQVLGMVLFINVLSVQAQMAQLLGNVLQLIGLSFLLILPIIRFMPKAEAAQIQAAQDEPLPSSPNPTGATVLLPWPKEADAAS